MLLVTTSINIMPQYLGLGLWSWSGTSLYTLMFMIYLTTLHGSHRLRPHANFAYVGNAGTAHYSPKNNYSEEARQHQDCVNIGVGNYLHGSWQFSPTFGASLLLNVQTWSISTVLTPTQLANEPQRPKTTDAKGCSTTNHLLDLFRNMLIRKSQIFEPHEERH